MLPAERWPVREDPELDAHGRTAHAHVGTAVAASARVRVPDRPFEAALLAGAAAVPFTAFVAWQPDDDPARFPELVARGFDLVGAGLA